MIAQTGSDLRNLFQRGSTFFIWLSDGPTDDLMYSNSASVILRSACGVSATKYHHAAHHISAKIPEIILHVF
jgi:hypothetical protein